MAAPVHARGLRTGLRTAMMTGALDLRDSALSDSFADLIIRFAKARSILISCDMTYLPVEAVLAREGHLQFQRYSDHVTMM
jgi:hypothetical protein